MSSGRSDSMPRSPRERRIVYHGGSRARFEAVVAAMAMTEGAELSRHLGLPILTYGATRHRMIPVFDVASAEGVLGASYVSLLVVDLCGDGASLERCAGARRLLHALDETEDRELRYGFHRVLVLLPEAGDG